MNVGKGRGDKNIKEFMKQMKRDGLRREMREHLRIVDEIMEGYREYMSKMKGRRFQIEDDGIRVVVGGDLKVREISMNGQSYPGLCRLVNEALSLAEREISKVKP